MWNLFASFLMSRFVCVFAVMKMKLIHPTVRIDTYSHDGGEACEGKKQWQLCNVGVFVGYVCNRMCIIK